MKLLKNDISWGNLVTICEGNKTNENAYQHSAENF